MNITVLLVTDRQTDIHCQLRVWTEHECMDSGHMCLGIKSYNKHVNYFQIKNTELDQRRFCFVGRDEGKTQLIYVLFVVIVVILYHSDFSTEPNSWLEQMIYLLSFFCSLDSAEIYISCSVHKCECHSRCLEVGQNGRKLYKLSSSWYCLKTNKNIDLNGSFFLVWGFWPLNYLCSLIQKQPQHGAPSLRPSVLHEVRRHQHRQLDVQDVLQVQEGSRTRTLFLKNNNYFFLLKKELSFFKTKQTTTVFFAKTRILFLRKQ